MQWSHSDKVIQLTEQHVVPETRTVCLQSNAWKNMKKIIFQKNLKKILMLDDPFPVSYVCDLKHISPDFI